MRNIIIFVLTECGLACITVVVDRMTDIAPTWLWGIAALVFFLPAIALLSKWPNRMDKKHATGDSEPLGLTPGRPAHEPYTIRTPEEILAEFNNRTDLQAEKVVQSYAGQWLRLEGRIYNVYENSGSIVVMLDSEMAPSIHLKFNKERWLRNLETTTAGDNITAEGKISRIDRMTMVIEHCEVIEIRRNDRQATSL